ncbi:ROK family protein (plasmid) [Deinococcus taeanensis]|uniref:ROK family protein n=1 Tax=Deinococcus taeanensis TaxID=2737050 RepID=UPI001CDB7B53|nr:ROK family protein [Deinococcus taeanensis]UBV44441.1 ROK family protein [Deinococcus taeanensis]
MPLPLPASALRITRVVTWLDQQGHADRSVISVKGQVNSRTRTAALPWADLTDQPLEAELSAALGRPVIVENDANLAAWQAWHPLNLTPDDPLVFLNSEFGLGLGLMLGGQLYHCATGELSYAADPAKRRRHDLALHRLLGHLRGVDPETDIITVAALAAGGHTPVKRALRAYTTDLANHLTSAVTILNPAALVLQDLPPASERLRREVTRALTELGLPTRAVISPLGLLGGLDSAARYGVAWLERAHLSAASDFPAPR